MPPIKSVGIEYHVLSQVFKEFRFNQFRSHKSQIQVIFVTLVLLDSKSYHFDLIAFKSD